MPFFSVAIRPPQPLRGKFSPLFLILVCLLLPAAARAQTTAPKEWTWMGGSSSVGSNGGQPGVYGTLGTPAAGNIPGGRQGTASWTDIKGDLWLFGGVTFDATGRNSYLNDLWNFNPSTNEWAWMGGSSMASINNCDQYRECGQPGVYRTLGMPAAGNIPGGRFSPSSWTDGNGNFWLFGGYGFDAVGAIGNLNDLWEYNPSTNEWAWMGGSSAVSSNNCNQYGGCGLPGVYGTLGTTSVGNVPGGRLQAVSWIDGSGNLWLFGGTGLDADSQFGDLNDLWEFNPATNEWAWVGGRNTSASLQLCSPFGGNCDGGGVYGTLGTPAAGNFPGARDSDSSWTDRSGRLWLFGGIGYDAANVFDYLNDIWEFDPSTEEWTWMGGSSYLQGGQIGRPGVYGTLGTFAAGNNPGGRFSPESWTDSNGNFWLLGGYGYDSAGNPGWLNDLWAFNPSTKEWAWMGGNSTVRRVGGGNNSSWPGVYGTLGMPDAANLPGSREVGAGWTDHSGNLWLFGGAGFDENDIAGNLNDLWEYEPPHQCDRDKETRHRCNKERDPRRHHRRESHDRDN